MPIPADCDICHRQFQAEPDNIVECLEVKDDELPVPGAEPVDYIFVCPDCDLIYCHYWDDYAD